MNETAIIAIVGFITTLLAATVPRFLDYHYSEKKEKKNRRKNIIAKAKELTEDASKSSYELYLFIQDWAKYAQERVKGTDSKAGQTFMLTESIQHSEIMKRANWVTTELSELGINAHTYKETRNLSDKIGESVLKATGFILFANSKYEKRKFSNKDLAEVKARQYELEKNLVELRNLKL